MAVRHQQNERGQQRVKGRTLPVIQSQGFRYPTSLGLIVRGARYDCFRRHVINPDARPPSTLVALSSLPQASLHAFAVDSHLVYTLCKIGLRPRRPSTWCHLSLAASRVDHWQAYFPIGFTNSTPAHAVPCCMITVETLSLLPSTASIGLVSAEQAARALR